MNGPLEDRILKLQTLEAVQSADIAAPQYVLVAMREILVRALPEVAKELPDVNDTLLRVRKEILHAILEDLEKKDPALAARIQEQIDKGFKNYPLGYD
jgi:hypothetical protein